MSLNDKPVVWLQGEIKTPPLSAKARMWAGYLLRQLQKGTPLSLPHSRPMPVIGANCHELRIKDNQTTWRVMYYLDKDAVVILDVFSKKTQQTPQHIIVACQQRLQRYKNAGR
ncbi:MAG: type II toxin-antitoxin system RelE/ParE family toxin [Chloroflexi bacterium]|nr:type II toxin-antitoxin system RelE/ParE family toxin [Chloroflexota bacterium]